MKSIIYILLIISLGCNEHPKPYYQQEQKKVDTLNVKDFGAVGDGVIDDWFPVQAACLYAHEGDIIYFPNGTYIISRPIIVGNMVNLKGAKMATLIIADTTQK